GQPGPVAPGVDQPAGRRIGDPGAELAADRARDQRLVGSVPPTRAAAGRRRHLEVTPPGAADRNALSARVLAAVALALGLASVRLVLRADAPYLWVFLAWACFFGAVAAAGGRPGPRLLTVNLAALLLLLGMTEVVLRLLHS